MLKFKTTVLTVIGTLIVAGGGVVAYAKHDDGMATITEVKPFMLETQTAYQECNSKKRTTYTKAGDKYNVIGGVAGGATGAIVAHAITANPVILAGGAIAGVFGGQAIERHVKKPQAHTSMVEHCSIKYKTTQTQAGYLVSFIHNNASGSRVLPNKPLANKIALTTLDAAPTPEQLNAKVQNKPSS